MNPLRLLAIIEAYSITGPAKNLLEFARLAREADVETVITTFHRPGAPDLFIETARAQNTPVEVIEERGVYDRHVIAALKEVVRRRKPDILQTHAVKSHFLVRWSGLARRTPWVAFHHGYTQPTMKARLYNQLDRWSLRAAHRVVTVSLPFREQLAARGVAAGRIETVHNSISADWGKRFREPETSASLRSSLGIGPDRKVVLMVGRLSKEKDHRTLIEAISRLPRETRPHLVIVGDGPERHSLELITRQRHIEASFTGQQNSAEPFYGISDVAALSSRSEGSPNTLLEGMAAGVPILATRVGGVPEMVTDRESALLVPPGDTAAMSASLAQLLSDQALARGLAEQASERVRLHHDPEARMRRLIAIYTSLSRATS